MLSEQFIAELKARNEIEQVISSYLDVKKRGRNLVGLCPFHSEKTPSFTVYEDSQSFYCFGCGAGGDVVTFIRRIENLEYIEAVRFLANRVGMAMPEDGFDDQLLKRKQRVLEINRQTARFFYQNLISTPGKKAMAYLTERGLSENTIRRFGVGYAPAGWDHLLRHLRLEGFKTEELLDARVISRSSKGSYYDLFRDRIVFPIIDVRGNVIAFGGRIMDTAGPKYLNSPDTPVFKKSRNLFALNFAKSSQSRSMILAEGYMDVIALHQAGFTNAVATLGTALTAEQSRMISQYADGVVIAYDTDEAGQNATNRAINLFGEIGLSVKVLKMAGAKDPDEYIKKFGAARFRSLLEQSGSAMDFEIEKRKAKYDLDSADGKVAFLKDIAQFLAGVKNPIERDVYLSKIAEELDVSKQPLQSQIAYLMKQKQKKDDAKRERDLTVFAMEKAKRSDPVRNEHLKQALAEERLIGALLKNPDYYDLVREKIDPEDFVITENKEIFRLLLQRIAENLPTDLIWFSEVLDDGKMGKLAGILADSTAKQTTKKETIDYIETIVQAKRKKSGQQIKEMDRGEWERYMQGLSEQKR